MHLQSKNSIFAGDADGIKARNKSNKKLAYEQKEKCGVTMLNISTKYE